MSCAHSSFTLLLSFLFCSTEGALHGHGLFRCQFSFPDGHDALYLEDYYFNKVLIMQYNSTIGTVTGYTTIGKLVAEYLNARSDYVSHVKWKTRICKENSSLTFSGLLNPVEPYIRLNLSKAASGKHPAILQCSAYNFYPKQMKITWLRDGREAKSDVTSTNELSNGNWLYQMHSFLEYTPIPGEKITCMVEHASFKKPKLYNWDPTPDPGKHKIIVGIVGLLLGVFFSVAGLIYYRISSANQLHSLGSSRPPSARPKAPAVLPESSTLLPQQS